MCVSLSNIIWPGYLCTPCTYYRIVVKLNDTLLSEEPIQLLPDIFALWMHFKYSGHLMTFDGCIGVNLTWYYTTMMYKPFNHLHSTIFWWRIVHVWKPAYFCICIYFWLIHCARFLSSQGYYKDTVEFYFDSRNECKNFWKKCIEHHAFFRCHSVKRLPRNKTRVVSRGSSFR